jgi:hypothetical protein
MRATSDVLRQIARYELDKLFPASEPRARNDLITSVVRQWQTCAGHAGVFTVAVSYWLHFEETADGRSCVHRAVTSSGGLLQLLRSRGAQEDDLSRILRQLTLRQASVFDTEAMLTLQARVSPHLRRFEVGPTDDSE